MMPSKPLIDMRTRPIFLHEFFGAVPDTPEFETVRWLNKRVGTKNPDHFSRSRTLASFLSEMNSAGIGRGVVVGRSVPSTRISNDTISETVQRAHGKLIGIASVDPVYLGISDGLAELDRAITELGLAGLNIDAGFYKTPLRASDDRLMPFYEACDARGIPVCIMSGPTTPDLHFNDPYAVDVVAKTFPQLKIIFYNSNHFCNSKSLSAAQNYFLQLKITFCNSKLLFLTQNHFLHLNTTFCISKLLSDVQYHFQNSKTTFYISKPLSAIQYHF